MRGRQKAAAAIAAGILIAGPSAAFWAAPATATSAAAPGSELAGINANATASAVQFEIDLPGLLPLGNAARGDVVNISAPYATSAANTGPTTSGIASPAWPGTALSNGGSLIETFSPKVPHAIVKLLNDPVVARSTYPAQLNVKTKGKFDPTGSSEAGIGTSTSESSAGATNSRSALTDAVPIGPTSPLAGVTKLLSLGKNAASGPLIEVGSAVAASQALVHSASVSTSSHSNIDTITVAGVIKIDGVSSDAAATSDGKRGKQSSHLHIGAVSVAGVAASIGPTGITLNKKANDSLSLVPVANAVLSALQVAGVTIHTVAPASQVKGSAAEVTSGALQIGFEDNSVPNLGALFPQLPLLLPNALGVHINFGASEADADATPLPGFTTPGTQPPATTPPSTGTTLPTGPSGIPPVSGGSLPTLPGATTPPLPGQTPVVAIPAANSVFGLPVRVAWVVGALVLSLFAAGPLLAYANWQLLRGRTS
jgi:hypothetical protein